MRIVLAVSLLCLPLAGCAYGPKAPSTDDLPKLSHDFYAIFTSADVEGAKAWVVFPFWIDRSILPEDQWPGLVKDAGPDILRSGLIKDTRVFQVPEKADASKWDFLAGGRDRTKIHIVDCVLTKSERGIAIIFSSESGAWKIIGMDDNQMYDKLHD